jgi:hypothetical protein
VGFLWLGWGRFRFRGRSVEVSSPTQEEVTSRNGGRGDISERRKRRYIGTEEEEIYRNDDRLVVSEQRYLANYRFEMSPARTSQMTPLR